MFMDVELKKSEIKKIEKAANKATYTNDCTLTGWHSDCKVDSLGFVKVDCEIFHGLEERASVRVELQICTWDRRKSFAKAYVN